jgi:hypothetical protein
MRKTLFPLTLAAALGLAMGAAAAPEDISTGVMLGKDAEAITSALVAKGYEVRKVEIEDHELEAYALKAGARYEIYVDMASGAVTKVKAND